MTTLDTVSIVGIATTITSLAVKVVGLPAQIRLSHKRKSTQGLSLAFFVSGFISYLLWTLYGALKKDWVLIIGQGAGAVTMGGVLLQMLMYRRSGE